MYCNKCGKVLESGSRFCSACGVEQPNGQSYAGGHQQGYGQPVYYGRKPVHPDDRGGFLWGLLGFFGGLILSIVLYAVWKEEYPQRAKSILTGMIVGIITGAVLFILYLIIFSIVFSNIDWEKYATVIGGLKNVL